MLKLTDGVFVIPAGFVGGVTVILLRHFTHMTQAASAFLALGAGIAVWIALYAVWRIFKRRNSN